MRDASGCGGSARISWRLAGRPGTKVASKAGSKFILHFRQLGLCTPQFEPINSQESLYGPVFLQDSQTLRCRLRSLILVMQPWSSQTSKCIFCNFRSIVRLSPSRSGSRFFHNGVRLRGNHATGQSRRRGIGVRAIHARLEQDNFVERRGSGVARKVVGPVCITHIWWY